MRSVFDKRKYTRNVGYTDHTILKWSSIGLADELRFSSLVSFQTLSPESFATKEGLHSLSLVSAHQGTTFGSLDAIYIYGLIHLYISFIFLCLVKASYTNRALADVGVALIVFSSWVHLCFSDDAH